MAKYNTLLTADRLASADRARGRAVFARTCAACHKLFDEGGSLGPNLTGSQRANLDYVLENMLDPSAAVPKEFQMTLIQTDGGRVITGIVKSENDAAVTVQTPTETILVPKGEIEARRQSADSMMPEGMLDRLSAEEVADLVSYLAGKEQVAAAGK